MRERQLLLMTVMVFILGRALGSCRPMVHVCASRRAGIAGFVRPLYVPSRHPPAPLSGERKRWVGSKSYPTMEASNESEGRPSIRLVACDIDGTLLNSRGQLSDRNVEAVRRVQQKGVLFVPATGKSRIGMRNALRRLGPDVTHGVGGVFLQGLQVYLGENLIFERRLQPDVTVDVIRFCRERDIPLVAFSQDRILCMRVTPEVRAIPAYYEPEPQDIPDLAKWASDGGVVNKLILLGKPELISSLRPEVTLFLHSRATLTQAQADMLEVLPPGGSKGDGVSHLLKRLNVDPKHVMAIGDAENDLEMLALVGTSVAVGNASPAVKQIAKYEVSSNNDNGVAEALEKFIP